MRVLTFLLALVFTFSAFTPEASAAPNKRVMVVLMLDGENDDQKTVMTIFTDFEAAEKVSQMAGIEMIASDDPIQDDVFVFALKSEDQKNMVMEMFDEEGYVQAAQNTLQVEEGSNYKAVNVETLENGTYMFRLTDDEGNEIQQELVIDRE